MKRYNCPGGRVAEVKHDHPERTAYRSGRGMDFNVYFQVWPNRSSMLQTIRMQESGPDFRHAWKPVLKDYVVPASRIDDIEDAHSEASEEAMIFRLKAQGVK